MARKYIRYVTKEKLEKINPKNLQLMNKFFNYKNMNISESTRKSYESDFNQFFVYVLDRGNNDYLLDMDVDDLADLIEGYVAFCTTALGNNERRLQRRMSSISSLFIYLRKKRKIKENPVDLLERIKIRSGEKPQITQTYLTKEQYDQIRKEIRKQENIQLELFFEVAVSTMARVNAISNIKVDQIDIDKLRINDVLEKEGKIVTLFITPRVVELINKWQKERNDLGIDNEYLFVTKYGGEWKKVGKNTIQSYWIKKIGDVIGIPIHSHDLRHSSATILYRNGVPLEVVSKLLNHSGTEVTMRHYIEEDKDDLQDKIKDFDI